MIDNDDIKLDVVTCNALLNGYCPEPPDEKGVFKRFFS